MKLILGGINGHYLRDITENAARETEEVLAAVAAAASTTKPSAAMRLAKGSQKLPRM